MPKEELCIKPHGFLVLNFQRSEDDEKRMGEEEEGQEAGAEGGVEVDEEQ